MNTNTPKNLAVNRFFALFALLSLIISSFPASALALDVENPELPAPIAGCMDIAALNYNPLATVTDNSCNYPPVLPTVPLYFYCEDDSALNYDEEGACIYESGYEVITACKYNVNEEPIEGWGMLITNLQEGEGDVTFDELLTEEDGCVSVQINPEDGPFVVAEEDREGWSYVSHSAYNGNATTEIEDVPACVFFDDTESENTGNSNEYSCSFVNVADAPQCVDGQKDWADTVHWSFQEQKQDGSEITDINRTNPEAALGEADWENNDSTGFFSLGFGGSIKVGFDNYVIDTEGNDISIHEATNGANYPLEKAEIWVSQNGDDWFMIGYADNTSGDRVTYLDIASSGLAWIQFVKVIDVSDPQLHDAAADGFDLDAVDATKSVCNQPNDEEPVGKCEVEGHKYDRNVNPLSGWFMGLAKIFTFGEGETYIYDLATGTTDEDGYYCLEWDLESRTPRVDQGPVPEIEGPYSFVYIVYEKLQAGWSNWGVDVNDVANEEAENDGTYVSVKVTEDGYHDPADSKNNIASYLTGNDHVDFYNESTTTSTSTDENDGPYTLTVAITGEGEGDVDSTDLLINCSSAGEAIDCSEVHASGTIVNITAVPAEGSNFNGSWTTGFGTCTGNTTPCQVVMTQNVNLVANFDLNTTSNRNSSGGGRRSSNSTPTPTVAGISDSQVLGDQVSVVPYGAAGAGKGGASTSTNGVVEFALIISILSALVLARLQRLSI